MAKVAGARSCSCHVMSHLRMSGASRLFTMSLLDVHN